MLDFWGVKLKLKIKQIETLALNVPRKPLSTFLQIKPNKRSTNLSLIPTKNPQNSPTPKKRPKQLNITISTTFSKSLEPNHPPLFVKQIFPKNTWPWRGHIIPVGHPVPSLHLNFLSATKALARRFKARPRQVTPGAADRTTSLSPCRLPLRWGWLVSVCLGGRGEHEWRSVEGGIHPGFFSLQKKRKNFGVWTKCMLFF